MKSAFRDVLALLTFKAPAPKPQRVDLSVRLDRVIGERDAFDEELRRAEKTIAELREVIARRERVISEWRA